MIGAGSPAPLSSYGIRDIPLRLLVAFGRALNGLLRLNRHPAGWASQHP